MTDAPHLSKQDYSQPLFSVNVEDDLLVTHPAVNDSHAFTDPPTVPDIHDIHGIARVLGDDLRSLQNILSALEVQETSLPALRIAGRRLGRLASALSALSEYVHQSRETGIAALDAALTALGPDLDILRLGGLDRDAAPAPHSQPVTHNATRSIVVGSLDDLGEQVTALADLFAEKNWRITNLGPSMPAALAVSTVAEIDPAAFVLVVGDESAFADDTASIIAQMRQICPDIRIGLCGPAETIAPINTPVDWTASAADALVSQIIADTPNLDFVVIDETEPGDLPLVQDDVPTVLDIPIGETE